MVVARVSTLPVQASKRKYRINRANRNIYPGKRWSLKTLVEDEDVGLIGVKIRGILLAALNST